MKLRPYIPDTDFDEIKNWITDERTHAMWCANRMNFPMEEKVAYAFEETNVGTVGLNVFSVNERARKCYESVGFVERRTDKDAYVYKDELWDRCNMIIKKSEIIQN